MPGVQIADLAGGALGGLGGVLAALVGRERSGQVHDPRLCGRRNGRFQVPVEEGDEGNDARFEQRQLQRRIPSQIAAVACDDRRHKRPKHAAR